MNARQVGGVNSCAETVVGMNVARRSAAEGRPIAVEKRARLGVSWEKHAKRRKKCVLFKGEYGVEQATVAYHGMVKGSAAGCVKRIGGEA